MANMACIDPNTWYSRIDRAGPPDFVLTSTHRPTVL
jgi:hypothetical protein